MVMTMNDKEVSERMKKAGVTPDDLHNYVSAHLKGPDYTEEEVDQLVQKIKTWKQQDNGWEKRQ